MKSINQNAPVKCSKSIVINAAPARIWKVLTGINEWSNWQNEISRASLTGELHPGATFTWKTGSVKIHSTIHTVELYTNFGWTGKTFGIFAVHNWTLKEVEGKTEVLVDESMEGFLPRLFNKSFSKNLATGMQYWLGALKIACEEKDYG